MLFFGEICRRTQAELTQDFHLVIQQTLIAHLLWVRCPVGEKISPGPARKKWKEEDNKQIKLESYLWQLSTQDKTQHRVRMLSGKPLKRYFR